MLTAAATRSIVDESVLSLAQLVGPLGWSARAVDAQVRARRWQRFGRAVVTHNAAPTRSELQRIVLINAGPRAVLTSFTGLAEWGLTGWEREPIHLLVPGGARLSQVLPVPVRVHWTGSWPTREVHAGRQLHRPAQSAVLAAGGMANLRPACGVLAAVVQQRLCRPSEIVDAVTDASRVRGRGVLLAAVHDIAQGAHALSEIDFTRLCRDAGLPTPSRQRVRPEPSGRRRYLDVEWDLADGTRLVVEVDGALHLAAPRWWADQLRQNEFVIVGDRVLRFPSTVIRCEPMLVVDQLRRMFAAVSVRRS